MALSDAAIRAAKRGRQGGLFIIVRPSGGSWRRTVPQSGFWDFQAATARVACAKTIVLKIPTWPSDDENGSSKSSNLRAQLKGSSPATPPSTTSSTTSRT